MSTVGELQLLVLLSILRQGDTPYANRVREDLEINAHRSITRGALYRTLERLRAKGLVEWQSEATDIPARGGHPSRRLKVTAEGLAAIRDSRAVLLRFFDGLEPIISGL